MRTAQARSERLLVLAPTGRDAELVRQVFAAAGLVAERCSAVEELCARARDGAGALLVAEEALTHAAMRAIAELVRAQEPWSDLPVLVFSSRVDAYTAVGDPLRALGNVTVVERPLSRGALLSMARSALRARRRQYAAREVLEQVRVAVRQRDDFMALLGHELRNPLGAIDMAGELLERGNDPARPLAVIRRQTRQLSRIVDDLLDVSRVTAGKVVLRTGPVDLVLLGHRVVEGQSLAIAGRAGVELSFVAETPDLFTTGDEARLDQVLSNLVSNAVKYTPRGGHVRVTARREGEAAVLAVADDGIGISGEDLARIFEPFVQVSSALDRARGGMGLGLTLVRGLVELHGGTVHVHSDGIGRGSVFTVQLRATARPAVENGSAERHEGGAYDVIVVEDQEDVRQTFLSALEQAGHRVRGAADGSEALALARERAPDVAFIDIGLPGMDGYEVAAALRGEVANETLLVAVTGYGLPEDRDRAIAAGFDLHLTKPVSLRRVELLLRQRTSARGHG